MTPRTRVNSPVLGVALTYVGAIIGAGFASGREISLFFASQGVWGVIGALLAGLLFAISGYLVLERGRSLRANNYKDLLNSLLGHRLAHVADILFLVSAFAGLSISLAATGHLLQALFKWPARWGSLLASLAIATALQREATSLLAVNRIIVPYLILFLPLLSWHTILRSDIPSVLEGLAWESEWMLSSLVYVSYNMITGVVILSPLGAKLGGRGEAAAAALLAGGILGCCACVVTLTMVIQKDLIFLPMPLASIALYRGTIIQALFVGGLMIALYTTGLGQAYGLMTRLKPRLGASKSLLLTLTIALLISMIGFSPLVNNVYPLAGYLNLFFLLTLWRKWLSDL